MTTREQAMQWWESLGSASKTRLVDTNTELLIKGIERRWEKLTGREIEKIWRKETKTENIYLNRLKEQYKKYREVKKTNLIGKINTEKYDYQAMRLFCLDTQLIPFNDIELMEYEVNQSFLNLFSQKPMKVQHKNSQEIFELTEPRYTKFDGVYGYLVMGGENVFFIYSRNDESFKSKVTKQFEIL